MRGLTTERINTMQNMKTKIFQMAMLLGIFGLYENAPSYATCAETAIHSVEKEYAPCTKKCADKLEEEQDEEGAWGKWMECLGDCQSIYTTIEKNLEHCCTEACKQIDQPLEECVIMCKEGETVFRSTKK
jgi:hypothetical protein